MEWDVYAWLCHGSYGVCVAIMGSTWLLWGVRPALFFVNITENRLIITAEASILGGGGGAGGSRPHENIGGGGNIILPPPPQ